MIDTMRISISTSGTRPEYNSEVKNYKCYIRYFDIGDLSDHQKYPHITDQALPWRTTDSCSQVKKLSKDVYCTGEIGLDYFKMRSSKVHQRQAFIQQWARA